MRRSMMHHIKQPRRARPPRQLQKKIGFTPERFPPLSGRLRQDPLTPFGKPQLGLALTGRNPASRRLLPSLRGLIAFPSERTSGRHSPKCQRLFQWRIDGCRELTGNWFSPREAVGTQHDQSLIATDFGEGRRRRQCFNAKAPALNFSPSRSTSLSAQVETRA